MEKSENIGVDPIDGDEEDIYSHIEPWNQFSFVDDDCKYKKSRPPPTYINFYEYEDHAK